jgi:hypothetical protein
MDHRGGMSRHRLRRRHGDVDIEQAQREVRTAFLGGFVGQTVSGALWLASAALATWGSARASILVLVVGGMFIFPLTLLGLRLLGRPAGLPKGHPMNELGLQAALVLPLCLPVVGAATLQRIEWFFPSMMVILGAHYLPFVFLYGMRMFAALAAILVGSGVGLGFRASVEGWAAGAWLTGILLLAFALLGRVMVRREEGRTADAIAPEFA